MDGNGELGIGNWELETGHLELVGIGNGENATTTTFIVFFALPPTKVAETISFTVCLESRSKQTTVFISFQQLWSGGHAKIISFTVFLESWINTTFAFIAFEQL